MADDALLQMVAEDCASHPQDVQRVLDAVAGAVKSRILAGEAVALPGIGTLSSGARQDVHFEADPTLWPENTEELPPWWNEPTHQRARRLARAMVSDLGRYLPKQIPELSPTMADAVVQARCEEAFQDAWVASRKALAHTVDAETRAQHDHLADAARLAWADDDADDPPSG